MFLTSFTFVAIWIPPPSAATPSRCAASSLSSARTARLRVQRRRSATVKVGEQALSTNVYSPDRKSRLDEVQYGNGGKVKYEYDDFDRVTGVGYDNDESPRFSYEYDSKGRAAFVKDSMDGSTVRTGYDQTDRPNEAEQRDGEGNLKYRTLIEYDKKNRVKAFNEATANQNFKTEYTYDADNRVTKVRYNSSDTSKVDYVYDKLNRITSRTVTNGTSAYATQYAYAPGAVVYGENATTPLVSSITQGEGENAMNFAYTYDNRGNITSETRNGLTTTYVYDALGQLIRVNDPYENATWIYSYDRGGNILNKAKYAYTIADELGEAVESIPYTYGDANWKDKLTAYNGVPITYDAIGNPLNDGTWTYEWQAGRQLKSMTNAATGVTMEFTYNYAGLRTKKVKKVNGVLAETTEYILNGKKIVGLTHTDHASNEVDTVHFLYDAQGKVTQVDFNDVVYSYVHNFQGDIVGMLDSSGGLVVEYRYNAWGKALSVKGALANTLGRRNPLMYRGYIYDDELDCYYLRTRYFYPVMQRFQCADILLCNGTSIHSNNQYVYCANAPIVSVDYSGKSHRRCSSFYKYTYYMSGEAFEGYLEWQHERHPVKESNPPIVDAIGNVVEELVTSKVVDCLGAIGSAGDKLHNYGHGFLAPFLSYNYNEEGRIVEELTRQFSSSGGYKAVKIEVLNGSHSGEIRATILDQKNRIRKKGIIKTQAYDVIEDMMTEFEAIVHEVKGGTYYYETAKWKYSLSDS